MNIADILAPKPPPTIDADAKIKAAAEAATVAPTPPVTADAVVAKKSSKAK